MTKDIHHHFVPAAAKGYVAELPEWSVEHSLSHMDANGVSTACLSLSNYDIAFPTDTARVEFFRAVNDEAIAIVRANPGRFEAFAALPFPDVDACVEEVKQCHKQGVAGYLLYSNVDGVYPSMIDHKALFTAIEATGLPIFVHPGSTPPEDGVDPDAFSEFVEYPQEITRLICRFLAEDGFLAFPKQTFILSHGGGMLPFHFARVGKLPYLNAVGDTLKIRWGRIIGDMLRKRSQIEDHVERMQFDLYEADAPEQRAALDTVVRDDQLVYGSNFPYVGE